MKLNDEQKYVIKELVALKKPIQTLAGYAGTGKTSVIWYLKEKLDKFAVCAFTGKAANVLRKKGLATAQTIHSLIYEPYKDENGDVTWMMKDNIGYEGLIVDEASMISQELYQDLKYFDLPIIFVGDHGQLEPVGQDINLMKNPDYKLEKIHRNAGEIAHFAEFIRQGYKPSSFQYKNPKKIKFISTNQAKNYYESVDQIICAFNKTRNNINLDIRKSKGKRVDWLEVGDRIMCLRNNKLHGLFNGMQGFVKTVGPQNRLFFVSEDGEEYDGIFFDPKILGQEKYEIDSNRDNPEPFDWCDAITCHKSQGSEWDNVLVLEQKCDLWSFIRWAYTAATRPRKELFWATN